MKYEKTNTQFTVKFCVSCNHAWEQDVNKTIIHLDFPSYGLQRKTCPHCVKKQQKMEDFMDELENVEFDNRRDTL